MTKYILLAAFSWFALSAGAQDIPKWKATDLQQLIRESDQPTIINFWASFCKPCLEELPYFQKLAKKYESAGLRLVLVNLDAADAYPKKIKAITSRFRITGPVYFLDETDADLFCPVVDPSWSGAIPASLFINNKKNYRRFFEDQLTEKALEKEIGLLLSGGAL